MSFASSSSSASMALRTGLRASRRTFQAVNLPARPATAVQCPQISRTYVTDQLPPPTASTSQQPIIDSIPSSSSSTAGRSSPTSSSRSRNSSTPPPRSTRGTSTLTAQQAQQFLSDLLHLPSTHQFSPKLALQILTHKSYRFVSLPKHSQHLDPPMTPQEKENEQTVGGSSHNARLSFIGRRAFEAYLAMFLHASVAVSGVPIKEMKITKSKTLAKRLQELAHVKNIGMNVAPKWKLNGKVRSDGNPTGGHLTYNGMAVEAILGAVYQEFGSPAAHRAFHLMILPHLASQLGHPILVEKATQIKDELSRDTGDKIVI